MAVPVVVSVSIRFEPCLALAMDAGQRQTWLIAASLAGDLGEKDWPGDLPAALPQAIETRAIETRAIEEFRHDQTTAMVDPDLRGDIVTGLRGFMPGFLALWRRHERDYAAAAARLGARLETGAHDLGALFDFPLVLDPRRRGLRSHDGAHRLPPNRIAAIQLHPSAFNRDRFWHLGPSAGGRQTVYLPCYDAVLAAAIAGARPVRPSGARRHEITGDTAPIPELIFHALGDRSRRAIAQLLARETLSAAEIGRRLGLSPPAVSHHLGAMRKAGLILAEPIGASRQLSLRRAAFDDLGARTLAYLDADKALRKRTRRRD